MDLTLPSFLDVMSEGNYIEQAFHKALDCITFVNPYLSAPFLEIKDLGSGVYEVNILMHVQQPMEINTNGNQEEQL